MSEAVHAARTGWANVTEEAPVRGPDHCPVRPPGGACHPLVSDEEGVA